MIKYLAAFLLVVPTAGQALTVEEGCKVLSQHAEVIAVAKEFGLEHDNAIEWVADLPYVEPWSGMLASTVEYMYTEADGLPPEQLGVSTFIACVGAIGSLQ
jgi:hypothetical protein